MPPSLERCVRFGALVAILCVMPVSAYGQVSSGSGQAPTANLLRIFLDCDECDTEFLIQNVGFVDYVRDRTVADLHVLVTTQLTGGGGTAWTVAFIGQGRFQGQDRTLTFNTPQTATRDDRRKEFARVLKIGLVAHAADTAAAPQLDVIWNRPKGGTQTTAQTDPWNFWVFRLNGGGNFNGEESSSNNRYRFSASGNRTTDNWKINLSANGNNNQGTFKIDDDLTITSESRSWSVNSLMVKSLGPKWSVAGRTSVSHSSFSNNDHTLSVFPGIEYDIFPYSESTRRSLTIQYTMGTDYQVYRDLTIFDKLKESVPRHAIAASLGLRQPWGTVNAEAHVSQHLRNTERRRFTVNGGGDVRLFKGFSFDVFGGYDKIQDQISLKKEAASTEEVLLRLQQLATGYSYFLSFGISYRFGSIFNNVVNPRFGGNGGRGQDFFF